MSVGRNLLAGLTNSIWSALIGLAAVPFYLKYLGIEAYGLIGFFVATLAMLSLLDMGFSPTINREVARCSASGNLTNAAKLLHTLEVIYWVMAGAIALLILSLSKIIAKYWLQSKQIDSVTVSQAVMLMGLVVACRWPIGLYQGALIGAQRVTVTSAINIVMSTMGSLGAVAVLALISPTIEAFFIWQAGVGFVYAIVMKVAAWRIIGTTRENRFDFKELKRIWRFSMGMSGVAISALVLMQLDKLLLSRMLSLEDFGHYTLAGVVSSGLYVVLTPTFNIIYPRLSVLVSNNDNEKLINLYRLGTRMLLSILFPMVGLGAMFSDEILLLWTHDQIISNTTAPIVSIFLLGTALNGVMHFPYALQLAFGDTSLPLKINIILILVMVPTTILLASKYGAVGGALAWFILNAIYLLLGTMLTHRTLLKGIGIRWLMWDVGIPLVATLFILGLMGGYVKGWGLPGLAKVLIGSGLATMSTIVIVAISPKLRNFVLKIILNRGFAI